MKTYLILLATALSFTRALTASPEFVPSGITSCASGDSPYSVLFDGGYHHARVSKEERQVADLDCRITPAGPSCYEPYLRDAGYSLMLWEAGPNISVPTVKLYEVYIWGTKLVATLPCQTT